MRLKSQIRAGYYFLLLIIITLITFSIILLDSLDKSSDRILKENYKTIHAAQLMLSRLNEIHQLVMSERDGNNIIQDVDFHITDFNRNLDICKNNITETEEPAVISIIGEDFSKLSKSIKNNDGHVNITGLHNQFSTLFNNISKLITINQDALLTKNESSRIAFKTAWLNVLIFGTVSLLIAFIIIFKIPAAIIEPLEIMTEKIKKISEGDYKQLIEIKQGNEIGQLADSFNKMANKLVEYEHANKLSGIAQRSRFESIVDSLNEAIIVLDEGAHFISINIRAELLIGSKGKELAGKSAQEFAKDNDIVKDILRFVVIDDMYPDDEGNTQKKERYLKVINKGKEEYYIVDIIKVYDSDNSVLRKSLGNIVTLKDITELKIIDEAKTQFIATLSHELRTPVSAIKISTNLLQNSKLGGLNTAQEQLVTSINQEAHRLIRIINELLDISKIETDHIKIRYQLTDPIFLINYSLSPFISLISEKQITLIKDIENDLPEIKVDPEKISWVILNLLSNAIRFTPEKGQIIITVKKQKSNLEIIISDSGPGIAPENHEKIFGKYFQAPGKREDENGLGLGLAICKEIIEAHKGRIWVTSDGCTGSKFHFTLYY